MMGLFVDGKERVVGMDVLGSSIPSRRKDSYTAFTRKEKKGKGSKVRGCGRRVVIITPLMWGSTSHFLYLSLRLVQTGIQC